MPSTQENTSSDGRAGRIYVYLAALMAAVGGLIFGYDLNIMSGALIFILREWEPRSWLEGWTMASAMLGCIPGPIIGGPLADRIGRRFALRVAVILFAISAIGTAIPPNIYFFIVFRFIGGLGVGLASVVSPMYIAEIAPARNRGRLVHINQMMIVFGAFASALIAWNISRTIDSGLLSYTTAWRAMFASELVPIVLMMIGLFFAPLSPRWLMQKDRNEEALQVLTKINGRQEAERECASIDAALRQEKGDISELFLPGIRFALFIAVGISLFSQITGASAIMFYMPTIFQAAGFEEATDSILLTVFVYTFNIFGTLLVYWLIDRCGRRPLLLVGTVGLTLGLTIMGYFFHVDQKSWNVLAAMFLTKASFLISLGPLSWLIMSEVFPTRVRAKGMAICSVVVWLGAFGSTNIWPFMRDTIVASFGTPAGAYWIFAVICFFSFIFGLLFVPETKGQSLEEIQQMWFKRGKR